MQVYCYANMKKTLFAALLIVTVQLQAQIWIGETEAFTTAKLFLRQQNKQQGLTFSLKEVIYSKSSGQPNLFIFSIKPKGFIIVSALNEVLAYSIETSLPLSVNLPDHISYWLDLYNKRTDFLNQHPESARKPLKKAKAVAPLLISCWGQGCFHNEVCPMDSMGPCGHVSAGCVAIAMAQIMYYYKYPVKGCGALSYSCPPYGNLSANFGQTYYLWNEMTDTLHESVPSVAQLIYNCGISVKMQYGAHLSLARNTDAAEALNQFFYYPSATYVRRDKYSEEEWLSMIKENLDKHHPVYYAGTSDLGGHAFVCDGYDNDGFFHFNFGWDGVADGYYALDDPSGFSETQFAINNFYPISEIFINSDEHNIIYVSPEGNGDGSSWEQATNALQLAIFKSSLDNCSIWVKEGCYNGDPKKEYAFQILKKCKLYGGFAGNEPYNYDLTQRDFEAHPSVLDGNHIQGVLNVHTLFPNDSVLIDGFTIRNGNALNGSGILSNSPITVNNCKICFNYSKSKGGGLLIHSQSNSLIENCEFFSNETNGNGGAVNDYGNTTYMLCRFHDNHARNNGGAIHYSASDRPSYFINCTICNNTAKNGGGFANSFCGASLWNCLINNNTADTGGGCYFNGGSNLYNCTIVKNEAQIDYGGLCTQTTQDEITNCIVWGNVSNGEHNQIGPVESYSFCAIQDGNSKSGSNYDAEANNDGDSPRFYIRFKNANVIAGNTGRDGDWHLQPSSLCVDRGIIISGQPTNDLEGNPRLMHNNVDFGAYETNTVAHTIDAEFCEDLPYYYNDTLLPQPGYYAFFYPNPTYDSIVFIQLNRTIIPIKAEICPDETYDFFGTLLHEEGFYSMTIDCKTYELELNLKPMPVVYMEEEICEGEFYDFFGTILYETGHYSTSYDCKAFELDLIVKPRPTSFNYTEAEICEGDTYNFLGQLFHSEGHYSLYDSDCNTYDLDLTVNDLPLVICSNDTIIEFGQNLLLHASGAESYLWSTGDTTATITVIPKKDVVYKVTGYSKSGCSVTSSINVKVIYDDSEDGNKKMILFPNPANDKIEIYMPLIDEVWIYNLFGEQMGHSNAHRESVILDVSSYVNGIYIIHIRALNKHYYKKIVINH